MRKRDATRRPWTARDGGRRVFVCGVRPNARWAATQRHVDSPSLTLLRGGVWMTANPRCTQCDARLDPSAVTPAGVVNCTVCGKTNAVKGEHDASHHDLQLDSQQPEYIPNSDPARVGGFAIIAWGVLSVCSLVWWHLATSLRSPGGSFNIGYLAGGLIGLYFGFQIFIRPGLRLLRGDSLEDLLEDIRSAEKSKRVRAAKRFRMAGPHLRGSVIPALLEALADPEPQVVREAEMTLEQLAGEPRGKTAEEWMNWWQGRADEHLPSDAGRPASHEDEVAPQEMEGVCSLSGERVRGYPMDVRDFAKLPMTKSQRNELAAGFVCRSCGAVFDSKVEGTGIQFSWWSGYEKAKCPRCGGGYPALEVICSELTGLMD